MDIGNVPLFLHILGLEAYMDLLKQYGAKALPLVC